MDNKNVTKEDLEDLDINMLLYKGVKLKTGDEIKVVTDEKVYKGTLLGGKFNDGILKIITKSNEIREISLSSVLKVKVIREYGKFFTS